MKALNYREMSTDELSEKAEELQKRLFEMRSQSVTEKLENYKSVINTRREIARVKTVMRERERQGQNN
ncbi:MAG: 50S ribosomal protein L29 [Sedimentisphaerales bacterium]|nr:50S ribosomal protein L29 [Sedimentisphaerales bacterium]